MDTSFDSSVKTVKTVGPSCPSIWKSIESGDAGPLIDFISENPDNVNYVDGLTGRSLLHHAVLHDHYGMACFLIEKGANVNRRGKFGNTALHLAAINKNSGLCIVLIKAGADVHAKNESGYTPLHLAAKYGLNDVCYLLFDKDAILDLADPKYGETPLHLAAGQGHYLTCSNLILKFKNREDPVGPSSLTAFVDKRDKAGRSPLHYAAGDGHPKVCCLLIRHNGNVNGKDKRGISVLQMCGENSEIYDFLKENGATD